MKRRRLSSEGLTIVELLVAIAVAAIVTGSLSQVVTSYVHIAQRGRYLNLANSYVESKVESLRNKGYADVSTGTSSLTSELPSQLPPKSTASMTVTTPSTGIKQVDITINYKDQGNLSYSYTTYIGELGVGR
jgi:type II secretory pathway pseudopilin PulG